MPITDTQKRREYQREWARRKRAGLPTKIVNKPRLTDEERRKRKNKSSRKSRIKTRIKQNKQIDELLGTSCIICDRDYKLISHRKDGISHNSNGYMMRKDVLKHPEEFVRLCYGCHKGIHWVMTYFGLTWGEITERLKYFGLQ